MLPGAMADTYIDYDETKIYGDYAIDQITQHVVGRLREFDPALHFAATALRAATDVVAGHLHAARSGSSALHAAVSAREAPLAEARDVLARFSKHLESHRAGSVPYGQFFVEPPHTLGKRGPARVIAALDHVIGALDEHQAVVREPAWWRRELSTAREALEPALAEDRKVRAQNVSSPTLVAAREHWLAVYEAAKHLVAATLALSGSNLPLDEIFDDLAAEHRAEGALDDVHPAPATDESSAG